MLWACDPAQQILQPFVHVAILLKRLGRVDANLELCR